MQKILNWIRGVLIPGHSLLQTPMEVAFGSGLQIADEHAAHVFGPAWGIPPSPATLAHLPEKMKRRWRTGLGNIPRKNPFPQRKQEEILRPA